MGWLFLSFALFAAPFLHAQQRLAETSLSIEGIFRAVQEREIRSTEHLLQILPEPCLKYYALVYKSRSIQKASLLQPRVLVSCSLWDARFILAFSGTAGHPSFNRIEMLAFNEASQQVEAGSIHFPKTSDATTVYTKNPTSCRGCHGYPYKHIWDEYPKWRGVYDSDLRNLRVGSVEWNGWRAFKEGAAKHPLYSQLRLYREGEGDQGAGTAALLIDETTAIEHPVFGHVEPGSRYLAFNSGFTNAIAEVDRKRLLAEFLRSPKAWQFTPAMAAIWIGCDAFESFFPPEVQKAGSALEAIHKRFQERYAATLQKITAEISQFNGTSEAIPQPYDTFALAQGRYLMERGGEAEEERLFTVRAKLDELQTPTGYFTAVFRPVLSDSLDAEVAKIVADSGFSFSDPDESKQKKACHGLREESLRRQPSHAPGELR